MDPIKTECFVLRDMRTNMFFGGGKADELFSYWVEEWESAKTFPTTESLRPVLEQMIARRNKYADAKVSSKILEVIPLFAPNAYMIHKIDVTRTISEGGLLVT